VTAEAALAALAAVAGAGERARACWRQSAAAANPSDRRIKQREETVSAARPKSPAD